MYCIGCYIANEQVTDLEEKIFLGTVARGHLAAVVRAASMKKEAYAHHLGSRIARDLAVRTSRIVSHMMTTCVELSHAELSHADHIFRSIDKPCSDTQKLHA